MTVALNLLYSAHRLEKHYANEHIEPKQGKGSAPSPKTPLSSPFPPPLTSEEKVSPGQADRQILGLLLGKQQQVWFQTQFYGKIFTFKIISESFLP